MVHYFHGSFSYKNNCINVIIRDNVNIRIEKENNQIAIIYFVDDLGNRIHGPQGFTAIDVSKSRN